MKYIIFTVMVIVFISLVSCTTKEGEQTYATGLVFPDNWEKNVFFEDIKPTTAQPSSWDWRQHAILQPIRNQKSCGSCWSFSTIAVVETLYRLIRPMDFKIDLAEQTLVSSCSNTGTCAGGFFTAFNYIRDTGLPEEEQDPYQARNSSCKNNLTSKVKITRWSYIGSNPTTAQIKQAVYDHGSVSVDILGSFGSYSGGVYTSCRSGGTDHMVNIEGWVDDEAYSK
jgi:C1A family cysteine protease